MKVNQTIVEMLFETASNQESIAGAKIAAAIVLKKKVISIGVNQKKTHPFQKKFGKNDLALCIHAENDAIIKALRNNSMEDLKKSSMYIIRVKKQSNTDKVIFGLAKPCVGCQRSLAAYNIKNVYYSTDEGTIVCL